MRGAHDRRARDAGRAGARRTCSSAPRTRTRGSASSASCARPATAAGRSGCAARSTRRPRDRRGRAPSYSTDAEPDGTLLKCCGNRREAVCPSCARTYRGDAFQLVAAGMRGGKGVPETVAEHPTGLPDADGAELRAGALAPRRRRQGAALPAAPRRRGLPARRLAGLQRDPRRGRPAPRRAALPATASTTSTRCSGTRSRPSCGGARAIQLPRELARLLGVSRSGCARCACPTSRSPSSSAAARCTSTASLRLDGAQPRTASCRGAAGEFDARAADRRGARGRASTSRCSPRARRAAAGCPASRRAAREIRWGAQVEVRELDTRRSPRRRRRARATSPSTRPSRTEAVGGLMYRLERRRPRALKVRPHVRRAASSARGGSAATGTCRRCGCGGGRTSSGSAGTASPRAAATRRRSPRCARRGTSTQLRAQRGEPRDPWGRP